MFLGLLNPTPPPHEFTKISSVDTSSWVPIANPTTTKRIEEHQSEGGSDEDKVEQTTLPQKQQRLIKFILSFELAANPFITNFFCRVPKSFEHISVDPTKAEVAFHPLFGRRIVSPAAIESGGIKQTRPNVHVIK